MRELSLFSGAGGGLLGSKLLGWKTIGYVEIEDYCQRVIEQRIKDGILDNAPIFGDIRAFNDQGYAASYQGLVDIITGGFPCQDISIAGHGKGLSGERSGLWKEMFRTICTIRPTFAFVENSPMLLTRGLHKILCDFASIRYNVKWTCLRASDCGAFHQRKRIWLLATDSNQIGWKYHSKKINNQKFKEFNIWEYNRFLTLLANEKPQFEIKSDNERMVNGMAFELDRLGAIGNGQVPIVFKTAWELLTQ